MSKFSNFRYFASVVAKTFINTAKIAAITTLTFQYVGGFVVCYGPSMEPTLQTRDVLLTDHISPRLRRINIGDIVVAISPQDSIRVCKRVVAGPGDLVVFHNHLMTVPDDCVWLEGDNKKNSNDSRFYGPVPYSMIRRRCLGRIWPEVDMDLDTPSRYYLESDPTTDQKTRHIISLKRAMEKFQRKDPSNNPIDQEQQHHQ